MVYSIGAVKTKHTRHRTEAPPKATKWHVAAIIGLCVVAYWNSLTGSFVWDDQIQILKNWRIRDLSNIASAFTSAFWSFLGPGIQNQTNYYRPVQTIIYMVSYAIGGLSPIPYHVLSLAFHAAAATGVYLLGRELIESENAALAAGALFAVHPVHTEAVAWIAGVADVACGAFFFFGVVAFVRYRKYSQTKWLWVSCGFYLAALLSKEMAVTLPVCIVLLQRFKFRLSWKESFASAALFGIPLLIYIPSRIHALGLLATSQMKIEATWLDWASLAVRAFAEYIRYSIIPYPLNAFHVLPIHLADTAAATAASAGLIIAVLVVLIYVRKTFPEGLLWFAIFAITLTPVFYFKGISYAFVAERYLYIPTFAVVLLAAQALMKLQLSVRQTTLWGCVFVFSFAAINHNRVWANDEQLYSATLKVQPEVSHMRINLADIYLKRNEDSRAADQLEQALRYLDDPRFAQFPYERYRAHVGLGAIKARAADFDAAQQHFKTAIDIQPNGDWGYLYLGGIFLERDKDYGRAITYFQKAIDLGPLNEMARDYMGVALLNRGDYEGAVTNFREALRINPTYQDAQSHLTLASRAQVR